MTRWLIPLFLVSVAYGQSSLPAGPKPQKTADNRFWAVLALSATALSADGFTTMGGVARKCPIESGSPWLYGSRPSPGRVSAAMASEFALASTASYLLKRKRGKLGKLWAVPLLFTASQHSYGAIHNLSTCY